MKKIKINLCFLYSIASYLQREYFFDSFETTNNSEKFMAAI